MLCTMARPRPEPWTARSIAFAARWKEVNRPGRSASGMPMPVSVTVTTALPSTAPSRHPTRPPGPVNLIAFSSRARSTRCSWPASPCTQTCWVLLVISRSLAAAAGASSPCTPAASTASSTGAAPEPARPAARSRRIRAPPVSRRRSALRRLADSPRRVAWERAPPGRLDEGQAAAVAGREPLGGPQDAGERRGHLGRHGGDERVLALVEHPQLAEQARLALMQQRLAGGVVDVAADRGEQ